MGAIIQGRGRAVHSSHSSHEPLNKPAKSTKHYPNQSEKFITSQQRPIEKKTREIKRKRIRKGESEKEKEKE